MTKRKYNPAKDIKTQLQDVFTVTISEDFNMQVDSANHSHGLCKITMTLVNTDTNADIDDAATFMKALVAKMREMHPDE